MLLFVIFSCLYAGLVGRGATEYLQPVNPIGQTTFDLDTLKFVSVVARHGSRSPLHTYPTDCCPYNDLRYWPDGKGRLTKKGKIETYALGVQLRSRYDGFISDTYYDNETIFQSNAYDRDLTSSQGMAAGLYPPKGFQIWNDSLLWQPIAVWITDYDVSDTENDCPKYKEEQEEIVNELKTNLYPQYENLTEAIANFTGLNTTKAWSSLSDIYEDIILLADNGYDTPDWANATIMNELYALLSYTYKEKIVGTETMKQLIAGPVLKSLSEQFTNKTEGTLDPDRKLFVLAAHDTTIVALVGALNISELLIPYPASYLAFEIHYNQTTDTDYVQVLFFENCTTTSPTLFEMTDCSHPCPLSNFTQLISTTIEYSDREYCEIDTSSGATVFQSAAFLLIISFITLF